MTKNATAKKITSVKRGLMLSRIDPLLDGVDGTPAEETVAVTVTVGVGVGAIATTWANC
jgi:hypothetical protein